MFTKNLGRKLSILGVVILFMLGAGVVAGIRKDTVQAPRVEYFDILQPNLIAETRRIKRMEIWGVPEGSRNEGDWDVVGTMKRSSHWFSWAYWELPIPKEPAPYKQVMVRAFNEKGIEVDRVSLPYIGKDSLSKALWDIEIEN